MPKLKTNRAAAKRFRITARGKVLRNKGYKSHLLTHKTTKRKRHLRKGAVLCGRDVLNAKKLVPYL